MSFHDEGEEVDRYHLGEHEVVIMKCTVGATCCAIDHEPTEPECLNCRKRLEHRPGFRVFINGQSTGFLLEDIEEAREAAVMSLEERQDEGGDEDTGGEGEDREEVTDDQILEQIANSDLTAQICGDLGLPVPPTPPKRRKG